MQLDILRISREATKGGMLQLNVILRIASVHIINETLYQYSKKALWY